MLTTQVSSPGNHVPAEVKKMYSRPRQPAPVRWKAEEKGLQRYARIRACRLLTTRRHLELLLRSTRCYFLPQPRSLLGPSARNKFIYLMQWSGEFRATKDPKGQPWLSLLEDPVPDINAKCARKEGPVPHQFCNTQRERSNETHDCAT